MNYWTASVDVDWLQTQDCTMLQIRTRIFAGNCGLMRTKNSSIHTSSLQDGAISWQLGYVTTRLRYKTCKVSVPFWHVKACTQRRVGLQLPITTDKARFVSIVASLPNNAYHSNRRRYINKDIGLILCLSSVIRERLPFQICALHMYSTLHVG